MPRAMFRSLSVIVVFLAGATVGVARAEPADNADASLPDQWAKALQWRCIGPANMGGRITALAVYEKDPCVWWAATASGGLLKTINNGVTFEHQFDHEATVSIGHVAVAQSDADIVWVGTGEANPRNSVSWGDGVYKSTDGGKTWKNMGLKQSFQIGRIAIHPEDPDIVYVGALGRLWGPSEQRGLYKTTDGGETWERILFVDDKTGVIDVKMHPQDPDTLLVATYERQRDGFDTNDPAKKWGTGSRLYKTTDGGESFEQLSKGLPTGTLGRIGINYYQKNPDTVFIVLESERIGKQPENAAYAGLRGEDADVGARLTEVTKDGPGAKAGLKTGDIVIGVDGETVHGYADFLKQIRKRLAGDKIEVEVSRERKSVVAELALAKRPKPEPSGDGNGNRQNRRRGRRAPRSPFSSRLGGQQPNFQDQQGPDGHEYGGIYKSTDGGESWKRINSVNPRPMYFSEVRADPSDENYLWVLGVSLYRSKDGGESFTSDGGRGTHADHHAMWIDPKDGRHIILGNDGGIYVTYDRGENWDHHNHMAIGQFYHVGVGPRENYRVYGGLQDNGSWGGPSRVRHGRGPVNGDWFRVGGGDGFVCIVDPDDPDQLYYESQNGAVGRMNLRTGERGSIRPRAPRGSRGSRYRFNWKTPFILSHHNSRIIYSAGNYVFRSLDQGRRIKTISPEITLTERGSATALAESPLDSDVLYVGTNDGALWVSRDGGNEWTPLVDFKKDDGDEAKAEESQEQTPPVEARRERPRERERGQRPERGDDPDRPRRRGGRGGFGQMLERLMENDANGDGKIQRAELPERMRERMFDRFDQNEDGVIDQDEIKALRERMQARRSGARRGGRGNPPPRREPPPAQSRDSSVWFEGVGRSPNGARISLISYIQEAESESDAQTEDIVSGEWAARPSGEGLPSGRGEFTFNLKLGDDGIVTGSISSEAADGDLTDGKFDPKTGVITFTFDGDRATLDFSAKIVDNKMTGDVDINGGMFGFDFVAERTKKVAAANSESEMPSADEEEAEPTGKSMTELLPGPRWVSSIEASRAKAGRVYVTFDGHRSDDDDPYVFVSENYGETWRSIRANLPASVGSTRVIREDIENQNILYLGTEFGAWVSIDRGESWTQLNGTLPTVAIHEFAIHPTRGEVVAATHGRSLWVLDVTPLRQTAREKVASESELFKPATAFYWRSAPRRGSGTRRYVGDNPPSGAQIYYSLAQPADAITIKVTDLAGKTIRELESSSEAGLHRISWDLRRTPAPRRPGGNPRFRAGFGRGGPGQAARGRGPRGRFGRNRGRLVESGKYLVAMEVDGRTLTQTLTVETDPEYPDYRPWEIEERELEAEDSEDREPNGPDSPQRI